MPPEFRIPKHVRPSVEQLNRSRTDVGTAFHVDMGAKGLEDPHTWMSRPFPSDPSAKHKSTLRQRGYRFLPLLVPLPQMAVRVHPSSPEVRSLVAITAPV